MRIIDLSHPISADMPVYPGTEPPVFDIGCTLEEHGFLEKKIRLFSHTGTHMDAPAHLIKGGKTLDQFPAERFVGKAIRWDWDAVGNRDPGGIPHSVPTDFRGVDFILIHTGWSRYWRTDRYFSNYPVLSPGAAEQLAGFGLKGIGIDTISMDRSDTRDYPVHKALLGKDIVLIENLTNLADLGNDPFLFSGLPLSFRDADGSPVRAVAMIEQRGDPSETAFVFS